jgi:thiamine monophosphate synthase
VADRETGPLSLSTVQATAAAGNPVTLFLYIANDAQLLEPYKLTLASELIIAAADEIIQLREKLDSAKQEITQTIRKLEQIYAQIEIKTL